ncbi:hypothetical protein ACF044_16145 [Microbacterium sp. NPDC016588]|uniref:hypothetical protein n=1 Tax=Microbacterium TaxID=33882 RepID=UPI0007F339B8|nr:MULTISPECIES: hypothetical protein [unclassified Microbacterium]OAN39396.1 hypothetical protein A4X16_14815 [Microbacterium sp. H83]TCJ21497.1 hypothetical protein E0W80_16550 [Microbacterium sp. PI-1]
MAIIFLASTAGAPGVTAAACALALNWPKPAILVEADTSKTSSIIPGALRGQVYHSTGLTEAAVADQYGALTPDKLWEQTVEISENKVLIPGFKSLQGAAGAGAHFWRSLVDALRPYEAAGYDILIDGGRLHTNDARLPLIREADSITLFSDRTLPAVASILSHWRSLDDNHNPVPEWLMTALNDIGHSGYVDLALVERATTQETWPVKEVTKQIGINLLGTIPWDPRGAAIYALGAPTARGDRTAYARAIGALLHSYSDVLNTRTYSTADNWEAQS